MRFRIPSPGPDLPRRTGPDRRVGALLAWALACTLCALFLHGPAWAAPDRIEVGATSIDSRDDGYYLDGDFDFDLKPRVADALERGLTLYFVVEMELTRARWYWFDEKAVNAVLNYRLSYHALTRQYRVSTGNLQLGYATLAEALGVISHVRDWRVAEKGALKAGLVYAAAVRMRLDTTQLPKPFQINAIGNKDWTLESDWKRFPFEAR